MKGIEVDLVTLAQTFVGMREVEGAVNNPAIVAMLRLDGAKVDDDETPWCSAFVNYLCRLLTLPRSKSLAARSWLLVGEAVALSQAQAGFDVVIFRRGGGNQPGPEVIQAPGHVALFMGISPSGVRVLGGNQGNSVSIAEFPASRVLGVRRLYTAPVVS